MKKNEYGVFELTLQPGENGQAAIPHNSKIKVSGVVLGEMLARTLTLIARSRSSFPAERESTVFRPGSNT